MASVTGRINQIKQPYGGYVKPSQLKAVQLPVSEELSLNENIHSSIVGLAVDYLTRFMLGDDIEHAFETSLEGLGLARNFGIDISREEMINLLIIKDLSDDSIFNACRLVYFDVWIRNPFNAFNSSFREVSPNSETINNIRIMVNRNLYLFKLCGGVKAKGFTFEGGGYTNLVDSGDGDFIADDTVWDIKTIKSKPTNKHTLQLLMYWIMGKHSNQSIFNNISCIGIFNPRYNIVYKLKVSDISEEVLKEVEDSVIGYKENTYTPFVEASRFNKVDAMKSIYFEKGIYPIDYVMAVKYAVMDKGYEALKWLVSDVNVEHEIVVDTLVNIVFVSNDIEAMRILLEYSNEYLIDEVQNKAIKVANEHKSTSTSEYILNKLICEETDEKHQHAKKRRTK